MNKSIMIALIQFVTVASFAHTPKVNLECDTASDELFQSSTSLDTLTITDLLSKTPESNIPDASLMDPPIMRGAVLGVAYSNECDNSYSVRVQRKDIYRALARGYSSTKIEIEYFNANLPEELAQNGNPVLAHLNCRLSVEE
jgi:hypothetical protein